MKPQKDADGRRLRIDFGHINTTKALIQSTRQPAPAPPTNLRLPAFFCDRYLLNIQIFLLGFHRKTFPLFPFCSVSGTPLASAENYQFLLIYARRTENRTFFLKIFIFNPKCPFRLASNHRFPNLPLSQRFLNLPGVC